MFKPLGRFAGITFALILVLGALTQGGLAQGEIKPINSGFDPATHAFSFENYGGDSGATNLTPVEMVRLFGDKVCASKDGGNCILSPVAKQWMEEINQAMGGGHCEGMAVLSALMYTGKIKPGDFGGGQVKDLLIAGNEKLQREIAYWWATQTTQPTRGALLKGPPSAVVAFLSDALKLGKSAEITYSIGIYKRDGTGGHAVTPYAIEDRGGGIFAIMVYDNNFPNMPRAIEVDTTKNTWKYEASINPGVPAALYEGDAETKSLDLTPSAPRLETQVCTFCEQATTSYRIVNGLAAPVPRFNEIYINGGGVHVVITDDKGKRLGRIGGKLVNEITGAEVETIRSGETWLLDTEPIYRVPEGIKFTITLDGADLQKETLAQIAMIGPGYSLEVQEIKLTPGQKDLLDVSPNGKKLSYKPGKGESPESVIAVEGKTMDYEFWIKGFALEDSGVVNVNLDVVKGQLQISTVGNKKAGHYGLVITRYDDKGAQEFGGEFNLEPADTVYADYLAWQGNGKPMTVEIDYKSDGTIDEKAELEDLQK